MTGTVEEREEEMRPLLHTREFQEEKSAEMKSEKTVCANLIAPPTLQLSKPDWFW